MSPLRVPTARPTNGEWAQDACDELLEGSPVVLLSTALGALMAQRDLPQTPRGLADAMLLLAVAQQQGHVHDELLRGAWELSDLARDLDGGPGLLSDDGRWLLYR